MRYFATKFSYSERRLSLSVWIVAQPVTPAATTEAAREITAMMSETIATMICASVLESLDRTNGAEITSLVARYDVDMAFSGGLLAEWQVRFDRFAHRLI